MTTARKAKVEETAAEAAREPGGGPVRRRRRSILELLPPHDPGPWPEGFTVSREQIYDDDGRLTG